MKNKELGLLLIYGERLPSAGIVFLTPVNRNNMLTKVKEALKICADRFPNKDHGGKYHRLWADGSLSKCNEELDRTEMFRIKSWEGCRYEWDFELNKFILIG